MKRKDRVVRTKTWTGRQSFEGSMYTEKEKALALYDKTKSIAEVIRRLGYPSRQAMYTWISNRNKPKGNGYRPRDGRKKTEISK